MCAVIINVKTTWPLPRHFYHFIFALTSKPLHYNKACHACFHISLTPLPFDKCTVISVFMSSQQTTGFSPTRLSLCFIVIQLFWIFYRTGDKLENRENERKHRFSKRAFERTDHVLGNELLN